MTERSSPLEVAIRTEDDIAIARGRVRALADRMRFDAFAAAAVTTAASELARNTWRHGGGGKASIEEVSDGRRSGIRLVFDDQGPGIPDLDRVLAGGYSTARSLGLGLSGTKRLVDEFSIDSAPGRGTKVVVTKWKRSLR
jgi:serine/threonine-protein kinase RsbT